MVLKIDSKKLLGFGVGAVDVAAFLAASHERSVGIFDNRV
jgi:hypothetical protein